MASTEYQVVAGVQMNALAQIRDGSSVVRFVMITDSPERKVMKIKRWLLAAILPEEMRGRVITVKR